MGTWVRVSVAHLGSVLTRSSFCFAAPPGRFSQVRISVRACALIYRLMQRTHINRTIFFALSQQGFLFCRFCPGGLALPLDARVRSPVGVVLTGRLLGEARCFGWRLSSSSSLSAANS